MAKDEALRLDLSRLDLIRSSSTEHLKDPKYLEDLTVRLGLNGEILHEQPGFVAESVGGLHIWQYPNQFSKYLHLLGTFKVSSYLEIGCRWGGTFIYTREFLKKMGNMEKCVAVDLFDSPVKEYCDREENAKFIKMNSMSEEFKNYINAEKFDVAFIDGDHNYHAVLSDFRACKDRANIVVFHDITNDACPGVGDLWRELKSFLDHEYEFHEMTDQYDEVLKRTGKRYLGIGVAVKKSFAATNRK